MIWDVDNIPLPAMLLHAGIDALLPEEALLQSRFVAVSNPSTYRAHMRKETGWTWCTVPSHMRNRADVEMRSILYDEIKTLQLALASPCLPRTLFVLVSNDNGFVADVKWAKHSGCCVWVIGSLRTKGPTVRTAVFPFGRSRDEAVP